MNKHKKPELRLSEIQALHRNGAFAEAEEGYLALLDEGPNNAALWHFLGLLYADEGKFDLAKSSLLKAIELAPKEVVLYLHLASVLKANGLLEDAEKLLHEAIRLDPQCAAAYNNLGALYFSQQRWQEAIASYQAAIAIQPDYIDAYYNLGLAFNKASNTASNQAPQKTEAMNSFTALLELDPAHAGGRFQLACLLMEQNQYAAAIEHFYILEQNHPFHFETQSNLATCYVKLGWLSNAIEHYRKALNIVPDDLQILYNLGVVSMQQGRAYDAVKYYEQALRIDPNFYEAHNNLATAHLSLGNKAEALAHFQAILKLHPDHETSAHMIKVLARDSPVSASPKEYVRSLFNAYADHYDAHLKTALQYQVPAWMYRVIEENVPLPHHSWDILDLGCGTGLCGEQFKEAAHLLIGVDLSEEMLGLAKQKQIYDQLIDSDVLDFLNTQTQLYDLIIAGDVLVYFGDLSQIFLAVYKALKPGGLFIFNAEISQQPFELTGSGRFAHSKRYLHKLIEEHHLQIVDYRTIPMRTQNQAVVNGHLYLLRKGTLKF